MQTNDRRTRHRSLNPSPLHPSYPSPPYTFAHIPPAYPTSTSHILTFTRAIPLLHLHFLSFVSRTLSECFPELSSARLVTIDLDHRARIRIPNVDNQYALSYHTPSTLHLNHPFLPLPLFSLRHSKPVDCLPFVYSPSYSDLRVSYHFDFGFFSYA